MAGSALGGLFGHDLGLLHCLCCLADIGRHPLALRILGVRRALLTSGLSGL